MRVVAFWAGLAGLLAAAALAASQVLSLLGSENAALVGVARQTGTWSLIGFTALTAVFLFIVAFTDRKV
jgi:hypothetical protein